MLSHLQFNINTSVLQYSFISLRSKVKNWINLYAPARFLSRRNAVHTKLSDASVMTLMLFKVKYQFSSWKKFHQMIHDVFTFIPMLEYSRFMRRCRSLVPVFQAVRAALTDSAPISDTAVIDSFPLPLCHTVRNSRAKLFSSVADIGYKASKKQYYYGLKVHVVSDTDGLVLNYETTSASVHDSVAAPEVIEGCPCKLVLGDKGYLGKKLEKTFENLGYQLWTPYRTNMRGYEKHKSRVLSRLRRRIESVFSVLSQYGIEKNRARSLGGLQMNIEAIILFYNLKHMGQI